MQEQNGRLRIAAMADLHCARTSQGAFQGLFAKVAATADMLVLCGDLTADGQPEEARVLAKELGAATKLPIVAVLGNHEYESGKQDEVAGILSDAGLRLLDGDAVEIRGVGFAGVKGFGGGFDHHALEPWGEPTMKRFVHEAVEEGLKLGSALARLRTSKRIAILHYSPIRGTVEGEPLEIFPFLGSSRLEEPLNRYGLAAVVHGHAHNGRTEGRTTSGVPVFNVAMPLLRRLHPDQLPVRFLEVDVAPGAEAPPPASELEPPAPAPTSRVASAAERTGP